jgi:hypothetical protein
MNQPTLPFQRHSATSRSAAESVVNAGTLMARVFDHIEGCGERGATDEEIQVALSLPGSTQRPRRIECADAGLIVKADFTRATQSGRQAVVWVAK